MKARLPILIVLLAVFGLGGWYVDAQRARQRSTLSGFFETQPTDVASRTAGRVQRLLVREGDAVHAGEVLAELDAAPARDDTRSKRAQAEQAMQQYEEVARGPRVQDIEKQREAVVEARANLAKLLHGARPEDVAQARAHFESTDAQDRKLLAGPRPQEIAGARATEREAYEKLAASRRGLTAEERAEAKARFDDAAAAERLAHTNAEREQQLYLGSAISAQSYDQALAALKEAAANRQEQEEAWRRAEEGTPDEELQQAAAAYRQARAALDLVLAGSRVEDIQAAAADRAQAHQALLELERGSRREDIDAARAQVRQQQTALAELQAGNRKEQVAAARAAAWAARANAESARANSAERLVRAPFDGLVERIPVSEGDLVSSGTALLRVDDPADIWIRVYVPETDLARVNVGSDVSLRADGVSAPIDGFVESIDPNGQFTPANLQTPNERGKQVFGVRIRLRRPDRRVKAGMYATVLSIRQWRP